MACLVGVENQVQLADVLEAFVQRLDEHLANHGKSKSNQSVMGADLDQIQDAQLALRGVAHEDEVQRRVVPVDEPHVLPERTGALQEVAHGVCITRRGDKHAPRRSANGRSENVRSNASHGGTRTWPLGDALEAFTHGAISLSKRLKQPRCRKVRNVELYNLFVKLGQPRETVVVHDQNG
jgi:hypothetical protein